MFAEYLTRWSLTPDGEAVTTPNSRLLPVLRGERGFEFAALFLNPDFETASASGRVARRAEVISKAAGLDQTRLLSWVLAFAGLSAAWSLGTGEWAENALEIAALAAAELRQSV